MKIEEKTITPDMARDWLNMNAKNRRQRPSQVRMLSNVLKRGEWKLTHQPIALDEKGFLLDGQHRLQAILETGIIARALVAYNAPRESFDCIDIGAKRNIGDIMNISPEAAGILRYVTELMGEDGGRTTPQQCEPYWPYIKAHVSDLLAANSIKRRYVTTAPVMAAAVLRLTDRAADRNYILNTWSNLVSFNLQDLPPIANSFIKQAINYGRGRLPQRQAFARGWLMFNAEFQDRERISIKDTDDAVLEAHATLLTAMNRKIAPLKASK